MASTLLLDSFLPYKLVNLANDMSLALSKIYKEQFDITVPEWRTLAQLAEQDGLSAKQIGKLTSMDKSKVSRAVKMLEAKALLIKSPDHKDNRSTQVSLTAQGQILYRQITPHALAWEKGIINSIHSSEYKDFMSILDKLSQQVKQLN
jgi:DNA-binding MarR family transcriptional regulator